MLNVILTALNEQILYKYNCVLLLSVRNYLGFKFKTKSLRSGVFKSCFSILPWTDAHDNYYKRPDCPEKIIAISWTHSSHHWTWREKENIYNTVQHPGYTHLN